jgi:hypothetical protein
MSEQDQTTPGLFADLEEAQEQDLAGAWKARFGALSEKHKLFLLEYIRLGDSKQAALNAKYAESTAQNARAELLGRKDVRDALDVWLEAHILRAEEVMAGLTELASASMADYYRVDESGKLVLDLEGEDARRKLRAVKTLKFDKDGALTHFELYDRKSAYDSIARYHGLFDDRLTVNGMDRDPVVEEVKGRAKELTDEELEREIERRLSRG